MSVKNLKCFLLCLVLMIVLVGCQSVKPYQRAYLNDRDMAFGSQNIEKMEIKAEAYREGAIGGGKSKTAGGCGCR